MPRPRPLRAARTPRPGAALPGAALLVIEVLAPVLAAVVLTAVVLAGGSTAGDLSGAASPTRWGATLGTAVAALVLRGLSQVLARRSRVPDAEQELWRRSARALRWAAVGAGVQSLVDAGTALGVLPDDPLLALPLLVATLGASALAYQGLIVWNRVATPTAAASDRSNGLGAVLVVVAAGELVLAGTGVRGWPEWQVQLWLLRVGVGFVLAAATVVVVLMTSVRADLRRTLVVAAPAAVLGGTLLDAASTGRPGPAEVVGWVVAGALLAAAAVRAPRRVEPRPATTQEAAVGSAVVVAAGLAVLVAAEALPGASTAASACAALAVLGAGARVWHVLRDLATTRRQALTDELTGIANRCSLLARLGPAVEEGATLLVLDLDGFKQVNDAWGHVVGDDLLRVVARRLRAVVPPDALLARLGGDQFAVLLPLRSGAGGVLAARVVEALVPPVEVAGRQVPVGVSVGTAHCPPRPAHVGADELLRRADAAMHLAKAAGGRRARAYDEAVDVAAQHRARLAEDLRAVLADPEGEDVLVHYQPQLDVVSGAVTGVEALVRWQHPRLGRIPPDDFLPLVEELGLMAVLTTRVLGRAAADSEQWSAGPGPAIRLAVNLSASCLARPELLPVVATVLARHPGLAERLVLEVTETAIMSDPGVALATMDRLCALGVAFSIDDYGTGFASLAYLHDLPAVELKLDRSFTARLGGGGRTAAIVAGTVELAHQLGMRLVAEGVEDEATLAVLAELGCDETQGYLHARPMSADDLLIWLAAHRPAPVPAPAAPTPAVAVR